MFKFRLEIYLQTRKFRKCVFHMIYGYLHDKELITCLILVLHGFLIFQEDQLGNNSCFARIHFATTILIIEGQ
jgi:hypothetical protein